MIKQALVLQRLVAEYSGRKLSQIDEPVQKIMAMSLYQLRAMERHLLHKGFLAAQDPRLLPVLPEEITVTRQFWMYCREDLRKLKRITLLFESWKMKFSKLPWTPFLGRHGVTVMK